ncbi:MAG: nucleotidyltransferase family protein [Stellaceae bacterium]
MYILAMKPSDALAAHRAELRQLAGRHGLQHPRVFGSVVSGKDDEESDLDLLVDPTETTSLFTLARFKRDAETLLGIPVSVLTPGGLPLKFRNQVLLQAQPL